jgi:hypothetical protein
MADITTSNFSFLYFLRIAATFCILSSVLAYGGAAEFKNLHENRYLRKDA